VLRQQVYSQFTACLCKMPDGLCSSSRLVILLKSTMIEKHVDFRVVGRICRVANVLRYAHYIQCVVMPLYSVHNMQYFQKNRYFVKHHHLCNYFIRVVLH